MKKSDQIRELLAKGLPISEIAQKAGASVPYVYSIKNGAKGRKAKKAAKRAVATTPVRRGRPVDPAKRLKRIEKFALALARELAKAA